MCGNKILSIAGLDPSSGAGASMDVKIASKLKTHLSSVVTCLTVQNSKKFTSTNPTSPGVINDQINVILNDITVNAVKIGLLPNRDIVINLSEVAEGRLKNVPIILDPIISSTTGKKILDDEAILALKEYLLPQTYLITPNINEASILSGVKINNLGDVKVAAKILQKMGAKNILVKGGHLNEDENEIIHLLLKENGDEVLIKNKRIKTELEVRGTGCALSTAIACFLNQNLKIEEAVQKADDFVNKEIKKAKKIGSKLVMI